MSEQKKQVLKGLVTGVYQIQHLRIQTGLRIVAQFKRKLGIEPGVKEDGEENLKATQILNTLKADYDRITDSIVENKKNLDKEITYRETVIISDRAEYSLVRSYISLLTTEVEEFKSIAKEMEKWPIYTEYLKNVRGVGPAISAIIVATIDIHKAEYATSLWKYAGLDVAPDGRGRGKYKEHLVKRPYTDSEGEEKERDSITFNPFLKMKLLNILGEGFIKSKSPYKVVYDNYKNRLQNRVDTKDFSKLHIHRMAVRYMVKMFLIDLYREWRALEGLEVYAPYHEAKLGMAPHHNPVVLDTKVVMPTVEEELGFNT